MRKSLLSLIFLFFSVQLCFAQSYAKLDTIIYPQKISFTGEMAKFSRFVISKVVDNHLFIASILNEKIYIEEYDLNNTKHKAKLYKINLLKSIKQVDFQDFIINAKRKEAYLLFEKEVIIVSLTNKKILSDFPIHNFKNIFIDNEFIYLGRYYNHHPNNAKNKCVLAKYSKNGLIKDSLVINAPFPEYTHYLPAKLFAFNGQTFVVPLFDGYRLLLIDKDFRAIDTFSVDKTDWVTPSVELSESIKKNFNSMNLYYPLLDDQEIDSISRIEFVEYLDSNTIFVRYFQHDTLKPDMRKRYVDIYSFKNKTLKPLKESILETPMPVYYNLPLKGGHFPLDSDRYICNYYSKGIIQIKVEVPIAINNSITYKEFYYAQKEKAKTDKPIIGIWFFSFN